jgi:hypothetical protein
VRRGEVLFSSPNVVKGWRVGWFVSQSTVCWSVEGERASREKSCSCLLISDGMGLGRYNEMTRAKTRSSVMDHGLEVEELESLGAVY